METIRGTVNRVVFSSEKSGYMVLNVKTHAGKYVVVTGEFGPEMIPKSVADFHGVHGAHPKYGPQFKVRGYTMVHNAEELSSIRLFLETIAPTIGKDRSGWIVNYFKKDTVKILDEDPDRLLEVPGIGEVCTNSLKEAWITNRQKWTDERVIYSLRAFLGTIGLKERRIKKVLAFFGGHEIHAEESIREDPYRLTEIEGFGFTTVDFIAQHLGISENDPKRFKAFLLYCMTIICPSNGHLFFSKPEIVAYTEQYCVENNTFFLDRAVTEEIVSKYISELGTEDKLVMDGDRIYSKKQYFFETRSAELLVQIMRQKSDLIFLNEQAINAHIERFEKDNNIELSEEQRRALHYFCQYKVFIITGGPGTGKTKLLKAIVELILKMDLKLTCMTPTGISAKKLALTIEYDAYTIHRILGYRGNEWVYNETNPFDTDIVVVDESSMLDQEVMFRLLSAMKKRVHIIFVGDHNQLPSVQAGNVLREMIHSNQIPTVTFDKIFRQAENSDIIQAAHKIIHGDLDLSLFKDDPMADIFFLRIKDIQEIENTVTKLAYKFKEERRLFQIITPRNTGPLGVEALNQILQQALNPPAPHLNEIKSLHCIYRQGDRVMVRKNDYERDIYNGDIGKIVSMAAGKISIKIDERIVDISVDEVEEKLKLAYVMTCHKSQGQEYPTILLLFVNQHGKNMLQRNLLYTALTRAKKKAIVIGHGSAIDKAIRNTSVVRRNTILGDRICQAWERTKKDSSFELPSEPESCPDVNENKEPVLSVGEESSPMDSIDPW